MKKGLLAIIVIAIGLSLFLILKPQDKKAETKPVEQSQVATEAQPEISYSQRLLNETNRIRQENGLAPLPIEERLSASAQLKATDLEQFMYQGHVNPNTGKHGYEYIQEQNIPNCRGSENLAQKVAGFSAEEVHMVWMRSPAHRAAILDSDNLSVGYGVSNGNVVQHFCMSK